MYYSEQRLHIFSINTLKTNNHLPLLPVNLVFVWKKGRVGGKSVEVLGEGWDWGRVWVWGVNGPLYSQGVGVGSKRSSVFTGCGCGE